MKKKILIIGELTDKIKTALTNAKENNLIEDFSVLNESDLAALDDNTILMKGYIHTDDFLRKIIPMIKNICVEKKLSKPLLSHCAVFKNKKNNSQFILTDGACIPCPNNEQRFVVVKNAVDLFFQMNKTVNHCNVSLLSAGGDTNANTNPELYEWWNDNKNNFDNVDLRLEQLDVALNKEIRDYKKVSGDIADVVVCNDINQGNCIWKCLTCLSNDWLCGGILTGAPLPIILNSRGDNIESIIYTIEIIKEM